MLTSEHLYIYSQVHRDAPKMYSPYKDEWIRNCNAYSQPMTSHALDRLAGSRRTVKKWAAGGRQWPPSWKYDVIEKIRLRQSMRN